MCFPTLLHNLTSTKPNEYNTKHLTKTNNMALSHYFRDPFFDDEFMNSRRMQREVMKMFDNANASSPTFWRPSMDIKETENNIVIHAELPGVKKENISIDLKDNVLTISGDHQEEKKEENEKWHKTERSFGSFKRSISVQPGLKDTDIKASYQNGVLELTFPKTVQQPEHKKITIN
jgi:HSP20 family protein